MILFAIPRRVFQTFEFVDGILKCGHSNESYLAVVSCDAEVVELDG